ncbi:MAG: SOS response-associated peptidase [Gammaproteobacteria bacterium]
MCGRFALFTDPMNLAQYFGADVQAQLLPRYNVAPTQNIPILRDENGRRRFAFARWGLIPHWAKDLKTGYSTINARAETVAVKPAFRAAFRSRRCLIPADGFYEWQARPEEKIKQPWFIVLRDREPMAFAGLWERWRSPQGEELESCTIIVTAANALMMPIHDRMPVILAPADWNAWLQAGIANVRMLQSLLQPYPPEKMDAWPVGTQVNNPRYDAISCLIRRDNAEQKHFSADILEKERC